MPWRLLALVVIFALSLFFVGFNLDNRCTVSFGFAAIENIPVFFPLLAAFTAGMLFSFPFVFRGKKTVKGQKNTDKKLSGSASVNDGHLLSNQTSSQLSTPDKTQSEKK